MGYGYFDDKKFIDRKLGERSKLEFIFPQEDGKPFIVTLPFLENIELSETKSSTYAKYKPLGRSSSLFTYTGAEAREFTLGFSLTLPHILQSGYSINKSISPYGASKSLTKEAYAILPGNTNASPLNDQFNSKRLVEEFTEALAGDNENYLTSFLSRNDKTYSVAEKFQILSTYFQTNYTKSNAIIDLFIWWVNIIRSSCMNSAENPELGPPIVRLTHGSLYRSIPCIVNNYNIAIVNDAGYESLTMTPRRIRVGMKLSENRVGDFGKFIPGTEVSRDNLAGYEYILKNGLSMDPQPLRPSKMD